VLPRNDPVERLHPEIHRRRRTARQRRGRGDDGDSPGPRARVRRRAPAVDRAARDFHLGDGAHGGAGRDGEGESGDRPVDRVVAAHGPLPLEFEAAGVGGVHVHLESGGARHVVVVEKTRLVLDGAPELRDGQIRPESDRDSHPLARVAADASHSEVRRPAGGRQERRNEHPEPRAASHRHLPAAHRCGLYSI